MLPELSEALRVVADGLFGPDRIHGERCQRRSQLVPANSANELDRADMVFVEALCQLFENRILRVRCNAFDDQLSSRDSDGERIAFADKECPDSISDAI